MAKTLDFSALKRPTLPLIMPDEAKTHIDVVTPNEALVERLQAALPELEPTMRKGDAAAICEIYLLAAELISCNVQGLTVTADDLRDKYRLTLETMIMFFSAYLDFIEEIGNAKN